MNKFNINLILVLVFVFLPVLSLFAGFIYNEDLSTGGSRWDFEVTWPVVIDYSNLNFLDARLEGGAKPRHLPFHYYLLSIVYKIFNDQFFVRLFYLVFSLLMPIFLYLNLITIYKNKQIHILILSFSFLFLPFFRSSALWPNAHLTALIFFLVSNYFYLKNLEENKFIKKICNLLFLAFSTYTLQTYVIFFLLYLYKYFISESRKAFFLLFLFCVILGIPPLYFLLLNEKMLNLPVTQNLFYTITNNFSITLFFLMFFLFNKENFELFYLKFKSLKLFEIILISTIFLIIIFNLDYNLLTSNMRGGGFFYKISHFVSGNNLIFLSSFLISLFIIYLLIKLELKFLLIITLINIMGLNYQVYQKYFEPLLLVMIFVLFKNFLSMNIFLNYKNILTFYGIILLYFCASLINFYYGFSYKMTI